MDITLQLYHSIIFYLQLLLGSRHGMPSSRCSSRMAGSITITDVLWCSALSEFNWTLQDSRSQATKISNGQAESQ